MIYDSSDDVYICNCGARVRYSGILKVVTAVQDSKEHFCPPVDNTTRKDDIGLESMQAERHAQQEYYGKFQSTSQRKSLDIYKRGVGRPKRGF